MNPQLLAITERIRQRSRVTRAAYLAQIEAARQRGPARGALGCGNLAHGFAACAPGDKAALRSGQGANIGIVTAYNDMLSAHQPYEGYPERIRTHARAIGASAQVAGAVPAMCDGVTQGRAGMELSLFSRDVIAEATAVALSHDMFDAVLCLGICDKIVPGLLIGALAFGHLPTVFVPSGPMPTGIPNAAKAAVRERYAEGKATRAELLEAEAQSYHAPGTCTFYGTANSNQSLLEAMGLQLPGSSFVAPDTPLREALTLAAVERAAALTDLGADYRPIGQLVDERAIVNAIVVLLATGGSTNHTIHWVAVARAAGIAIDWTDFDELAAITPLLAHIYPNGKADVNQFEAAGGLPLVMRELLDAGLLHGDILGIADGRDGMRAWTQTPWLDAGKLAWRPAPVHSADESVVRPAANPFDHHGGLRLLTGNLGRSLIKVSALKPELRRIKAPAVVIEEQAQLAKLHRAGALPQDFVAVLRFQGPRANGMPELHSLTPLLGMLQNAGRRVALVTDGRLSGASGKIPAAIHVTPECLIGGPLARVREGDLIELDAEAGVLNALVPEAEWQTRALAPMPDRDNWHTGRVLFGARRAAAGTAEQGACSLFVDPSST
jgi:phosphogluconate dehydratase